MDRYTPQEPSTPNTEVQTHEQPHLLKRALNATGEFFKENKNKLTAAAVGGVLAITLAGCGTTAKAEGPSHETTSSAEATPKSTDNQNEKELTVESVELPASLTPEQLGDTFVTRLTAWDMAGATPKNQDEYITSGGDTSKVMDIVNKNEQVFTDAMFVEGWEQIDSLKGFADTANNRNASALETWFKTYQSGNSLDKEAYTRGAKLVGEPTIDSSDGKTATIEVHLAEYDNVDKNRALTLDPTLDTVNGNRVKVVITAEKSDTSWKISAIAAYNEN